MFYDAHIHNRNAEKGGFLVGLENEPYFEGTLSNDDVLKMQNENYIAFYYVTCQEITKKLPYKFLKFHPRRERYNKNQVLNSIGINLPKCVMVDTLNEPYWTAYDYWEIAKAYPKIYFIFSHAGGYLINDFIKICHFQDNVWIDFSLTHTVLGHLGNIDKELVYINQAIKYALNASFKNKILLGSDFPFFSQEDVYKYYDKLGVVKLLNNNFEKLKEIIK